MPTDRYHYKNPALLGTVVDVSFEFGGEPNSGDRRADAIANALFTKVERLEAIFSVFDANSELSRWRRGDLAGSQTSEPFVALMGHVLQWQQWSGGLFNPLAGELSAIWAEAEREGIEPDPVRLRDIAAAIAEPRFEMVDGRPERTGDCSTFNLNAIAKGFIVDEATTELVRLYPEVDNLLVNAGGDLCHLGSGSARVGIENPHRPYDNEPPLVVIEISYEAVATSGASRRGFQVSEQRYSHVLDPRTGRPARGSASATVVAPWARWTDVVATVAVILPPDEAVTWIENLVPGLVAPALIVGHDGSQHMTSAWRDRFGPDVRHRVRA